MMRTELEELVSHIGAAIKRIDSRKPQAANARTGVLYQPGIGPHPETQAVDLIVAELADLEAERYRTRLHTGVPYAGVGRQKCDLCIGTAHDWEWARTVLDFEELHYLEVDSDGNPTTPTPFYGRPLLFQPPMSARIGLSLDFGVLE